MLMLYWIRLALDFFGTLWYPAHMAQISNWLLIHMLGGMRGDGLFMFGGWQCPSWSGGGGKALMPHEPSLFFENYSSA